jgi:hypothetical protein
VKIFFYSFSGCGMPELVYVPIFRIFDRQKKELEFFVRRPQFYTDS